MADLHIGDSRSPQPLRLDWPANFGKNLSAQALDFWRRLNTLGIQTGIVSNARSNLGENTLKRIWLFGNAITFGLTLMFGASSIAAQIVFKREHPLLTFKYGETDDRNVRLAEPSAIAPIACGKYLLVADDKRADLLVVDPDTGRIVRESLKIPDQKYQGTSLDWEAMTKDSENRYYLVGSHLLPSSYVLISFRLKGENSGNPKTLEIVDLDELSITASFNTAKSRDKLKKAQVEGLAVWEPKGRKELVFGIREEWSTTIRVYSAAMPPGQKVLDLQQFFKFYQEKTRTVEWHLSSIEYLPEWGFLMMTSTESGGNTNEFYGNMFQFVSVAELDRAKPDSPDKFKTITASSNSAVFQKTRIKAEGLSVLSTDGRENIRVVIAYDNDQTPAYSSIQHFDLSVAPVASGNVAIGALFAASCHPSRGFESH